MNWKIITNPPFADDLFTAPKTAAWIALKQQMPIGTQLTGTVYIQAPFGVFYDAGLGFPVLLEVTEFGHPKRGMRFPDDYPPLGSLITGELRGFTEHNRQIQVVKWLTTRPTYTELFGREPDFRVTYRLFTAEEGGRKTPVYQGIRWDFRYEDEFIHLRGIRGDFMIYPEFLNLNGHVLPKGPIAPIGQANMFILNSDLHDFHRQHIRPGVRGFFMEGRPVGVCEVTEVLSLHQPI